MLQDNVRIFIASFIAIAITLLKLLAFEIQFLQEARTYVHLSQIRSHLTRVGFMFHFGRVWEERGFQGGSRMYSPSSVDSTSVMQECTMA